MREGSQNEKFSESKLDSRSVPKAKQIDMVIWYVYVCKVCVYLQGKMCIMLQGVDRRNHKH